MAHYRTTVETQWPIEVAFDYLASFDNVAEWDPGVSEARRLSAEAPAGGARFEVIASFLGRRVPLIYETVELEPPNKVVLRAETTTVTSLDTLTFTRRGGLTEVTYDAELSLRGPLKLADPLLSLAFGRLGDRAREGLARRLGGAPPSGPEPRETNLG